MQMSQLDEFIKKISSTEIYPNWMKLFVDNFLIFSFLLPFPGCLPWSFSPSGPPVDRKGSSPAASAPDFLVLPQQGSLPFWGPLALAQILLEEERHSPERVLETTQGSSR